MSDPPEFISEPIVPEAGSFSPEAMIHGLAALPGAFAWRGRRYKIVACLEHVKQSAREGHFAGGERYLRRQQFRVRLDTGEIATIYVERQARSRRAAKSRWFLLTMASGDDDAG